MATMYNDTPELATIKREYAEFGNYVYERISKDNWLQKYRTFSASVPILSLFVVYQLLQLIGKDNILWQP